MPRGAKSLARARDPRSDKFARGCRAALGVLPHAEWKSAACDASLGQF
jgi:hypothetical protein